VHLLLKTLRNISSRYAPSRILSFNSAHVFKTLQLIKNDGIISRNSLSRELGLGEGSIKTLIKHLKMENMIITTNKGTRMSDKGKSILSNLSMYIGFETNIPQCSISIGKFNHAVLLKQMKVEIKSGIEQRDIAIKNGAKGATTLTYENEKFLTVNTNYDSLYDEPNIKKLLINKLYPLDNDVIIIGSDDSRYIIAELAAKAAALYTLENHDKHSYEL
jgi:biotin operon repressor